MGQLITPLRVLPGFNHNITYRGVDYHIQTEDYGARKRCICTQLFIGGAVIHVEKTGYPEGLDMPKESSKLAALLKNSHKAMFRRLRDGKLDEPGAGSKEVVWEHFVPPPGPSLRPALPAAEPTQFQKLTENIDMANVEQTLNTLNSDIAGILGAALVDHESGMALGTVGTGIDLEIAAAGNMEVVRAKMRVMDSLGIDGGIEDILITLSSQFHIIRPVGNTLFLYVAIDRKAGNLALARHKMASVGDALEV